jgi:hypothetical protein
VAVPAEPEPGRQQLTPTQDAAEGAGTTAGLFRFSAGVLSSLKLSPGPFVRGSILWPRSNQATAERARSSRGGERAAPIPFRLPSISCRPRRGAASTIQPGCLAALQPDGHSNRRRSASRREKSLRLWQGVRRGVSVGGHVVRRWNPCPDPDRQVADNEQRRRGLKPRARRNRLTTERGNRGITPGRSHVRRAVRGSG